jgi:hypothetical protein
MTAADKEEMRLHVQDVVGPIGDAVEVVKIDQQTHKETLEALAKAVERLSLVVVGDDELKFVGLGHRVGLVEGRMDKLEQKTTDSGNEVKMTKTKVVWFALGAAAALNLVLRIVPCEWIARVIENIR